MRIAAAMSGGVDSLVAARLLQDDGHDIFGVHFLTGFETDLPETGALSAIDTPRIRGIRRMAKRMGIPLEIIDLSRVFRDTVAGYFIDTYRRGQTPNPCMVCNPAIKLDRLWQVAAGMGRTGAGNGTLCHHPAGAGRRARAVPGRGRVQGPVLLPGAGAHRPNRENPVSAGPLEKNGGTRFRRRPRPAAGRRQ
jgi:hypothetical protein